MTDHTLADHPAVDHTAVDHPRSITTVADRLAKDPARVVTTARIHSG
jgi:hypothetical protein